MMLDTPCARSQCPEMPKVSLDQAVVDLMESIALQDAMKKLSEREREIIEELNRRREE